jgi:hypothetical protein
VDVTFGDFLRAMVTADFELSPDDELGMRAALIEGFRMRGIYPHGVTSLAEESLLWEPASKALPPLEWEATELLELIVEAASNLNPREQESFSERRPQSQTSKQYAADDATAEESAQAMSELAKSVHRYATANAKALMLDPNQRIQPLGVHPVFRVAPSGKLVIELIAQVAQKQEGSEATYGGIPARGGTTLIVSFDGRVKYAVAKPLPDGAPDALQGEAVARLDRQAGYLEKLDLEDPAFSYLTAAELDVRSKARATFKALHSGR